MKLDKMTFAKLVAFISGQFQVHMNSQDIEALDGLINIEVPMQSPAKANPAEVDELMRLMAGGTQKIEAIKAYRSLTGSMLKESKDAVEKYWVSKPAATLSDILSTARGPVNFDKFEG
jgi:ribosomal protein L7/L12